MVGNAWQRFAALTACASIVALGACGGSDTNTGDTSATAGGEVARTDSAAGATAPGASTAGSTATPGTAGAAGSTMAITGGDPEILQVLAVVDQGEIRDGQLAQRQARNAKVKAYARDLVQDHQKSLAQARQLAKAVNATLPTMPSTKTGTADSAAKTDTSAAATTGVAGQLIAMHSQMMDQVRQAQGAAFDSAFVNAQVMGHQQVLDMLQRAQGQAQNSDVQQHLTAAMKSVQEHLDKGRELQQSLSSGAADSTSKTRGDSASKARPDTGRPG